MHRSTARAVQGLAPGFGLPQHVRIDGDNPVGEGVWPGGGIAFARNDRIRMRNGPFMRA